MTEDEMIGRHHRLIGHEFEQTLVKDREAWCAAVYGIARVRHDLATEQHRNVRDVPDGPVAKTPHSYTKGPVSTPGQGTRSYMQQVRPAAVK